MTSSSTGPESNTCAVCVGHCVAGLDGSAILQRCTMKDGIDARLREPHRRAHAPARGFTQRIETASKGSL
jgi:hypothetical protein